MAESVTLQGMELKKSETLVGMSILSAYVTSQIEGSTSKKGSTKTEGSIPTVLLVTAQGLGKRVPAEAFQLQHRNGKGNIAIKCNTGDKLMALHVVSASCSTTGLVRCCYAYLCTLQL